LTGIGGAKDVDEALLGIYPLFVLFPPRQFHQKSFGKLTGHCRAEDCQGCIRTLGQAVDRVATQMESNKRWMHL